MDFVSVRLSGVFGRWERQTNVRDTPSPQFQLMQAAIEGRPALFARRDSRDWIYGTDIARAIQLLRDAPRLTHPLYHVSTGMAWSALDWGIALARHRPGFECRLAEPGEDATIDLHAPRDRKQLSIARLQADTGFEPKFGMDDSAADYDAWCRDAGRNYP